MQVLSYSMAFLDDLNLDDKLAVAPNRRLFIWCPCTYRLQCLPQYPVTQCWYSLYSLKSLPTVELATTTIGGPGSKCAEMSNLSSTTCQSPPIQITGWAGIQRVHWWYLWGWNCINITSSESSLWWRQGWAWERAEGRCGLAVERSRLLLTLSTIHNFIIWSLIYIKRPLPNQLITTNTERNGFCLWDSNQGPSLLSRTYVLPMLPPVHCLRS